MRPAAEAVAAFSLVLGVVRVGEAFSWPGWGRCPKVTVQQDFDVLSYLGTWYEQAGSNTDYFQGDVRCVRADYLPAGDAGSGKIQVRNWAISQQTNKPVSINGTAVLTNPSKSEGDLTVTFYIWKYIPVEGEYQVLKTDYDFYSLVYSCRDFLFWHYKTVWALSRSQTFDSEEGKDDFYRQITETLWSQHIPVYLTESNQTHCDV